MKHSEINEIIEDAKTFFCKMSFRLPPVAFWSPDKLNSGGPEIQEILDCGIGWDLLLQIQRPFVVIRNDRQYPLL